MAGKVFAMRCLSLLLALVITSAGIRAELIWSDGTRDDGSKKMAGYDIFRSTSAAQVERPLAAKEEPLVKQTGVYSFTASLLTTCTGLVNNYPQNAVNYFFPEKHEAVYYFAYILISPPHSGSHLVLNEWYDPDGQRICSLEKQVEVDLRNNYITLADESYLFHLFINSVGFKELRKDNGQTALPVRNGLYYIKLLIDGQLVGTTFFRVIKGGGAHPMEKIEELRQFLKDRGASGKRK